ncbi:hypothetical protein [Phyllobacterium phragmitis]|nr:hypothetical protein [Phyllobacterium phragmitis]
MRVSGRMDAESFGFARPLLFLMALAFGTTQATKNAFFNEGSFSRIET